MLVAGYVRRLDHVISQTIPLEIVSLCESFYYSSNKFIYLLYHQEREKNKHDLYMADFDENGSIIDSKHIDIKPLPSYFKYANDGLDLCETDEHSTFYFAKNVVLPTTYKSQYDALFENNGSENIKAILINRDTHKACNYVLPDLPVCLTDNALIHSYKYGLFSIGGYELFGDYNNGKVYNLPANIDKNTSLSWKWNDDLVPPLNYSCKDMGVLNMKQDDREYLFVSGGTIKYNKNKNVRLYELTKQDRTHNNEDNAWKALKSMNKERCNVGLYFDKDFDRIYSCDDNRYSSYYDFINDKWFDLPLLPYPSFSRKSPIVWKENQSLFIILSCHSNQQNMRSIDLRVCKEWKIMNWSQREITKFANKPYKTLEFLLM